MFVVLKIGRVFMFPFFSLTLCPIHERHRTYEWYLQNIDLPFYSESNVKKLKDIGENKIKLYLRYFRVLNAMV